MPPRSGLDEAPEAKHRRAHEVQRHPAKGSSCADWPNKRLGSSVDHALRPKLHKQSRIKLIPWMPPCFARNETPSG